MSYIRNYGSLSDAVRDIYGEARSVEKRRYVSGGDINEACVLTMDDGSFLFMKANSAAALSNFKAEADGLRRIRETGAIGVPRVLATGTDEGSSFLLMEYIIGGRRVSHYWETFAAELAAMHRADPSGKGGNGPDASGNAKNRADVSRDAKSGSAVYGNMSYGLEKDNWIGAREQINTPKSSWITFFRDCRLAPQFSSAARYFSAEDRKRIDDLLSHLDRFLIEPERPSLVHGDLWSGNMITGNDGKGWLIDPAVYYGHPEVDIAMTELFGGFPPAFYDAYEETGMLQPGYEDRRDLYNLYQLLNHLNMFGSGYLPAVKRILKRYGGR